MRRIADIEERIRSHVEERWANEVTAEFTGEQTWWPRRYPLGRPDAALLLEHYSDFISLIDQWRTWASARGATVVESNIRVDGVTYPTISHIVINSLDIAARIAGGAWDARLRQARAYAVLVDTRLPHRRSTLRKIVSAVADWSPADIELLTRAASWFEKNPNSGLSPRQVPLEGFHTKWVESRRGVVARLAGLEDLGLLPHHPSRVHFTYLDPRHLGAGNRRHDSATVGDTFVPAYSPEIVIICENKDTAIYFPELPRAIALEGAGSGANAFVELNWIRDAPLVVYWGDMDSEGLRILAQFRNAGIAARSLFMEVSAYERWEAFGTNTDKRGNPISIDDRAVPVQLDDNERALYELLNEPASTRYRRVEQERIPLQDALVAIRLLQTSIALT